MFTLCFLLDVTLMMDHLCILCTCSHSFVIVFTLCFYRCLLDVALMMDITAPLKPAINNLLTSLCMHNSDWFVQAMETAERLLAKFSSGGTQRACVLQSLAHCSLSDGCILTLLKSTTMTLVLDSLRTSLEALQQPEAGSCTSVLDLVCSDVAFLTSLAFGHIVAQEWLVQRSNAFFWPDLLKCFDEPCTIVGEDLSFCQHTVQQFFSVCIKFNATGKRLFTDLLINAFLSRYSLEPVSDISGPSSMRMTPFIRTLVIDHLLGPEAVHMIVNIATTLLTSSQQKLRMSSLIPTYDSPHYHPSYPLTGHHYYLKLSSENTLAQILYLFGIEEPSVATKTKDTKPTEGTKLKKSFGESISKQTPSQETSRPLVNIFNCKFLNNVETASKAFSNIEFRVPDDPTIQLPSNTKIKQVSTASNYGCSQTRAIFVFPANKAWSHKIFTPHCYVSMLDVFSESTGLRVLARILPHLYPAFWPANAAIESQLVDISLLPTLTRPSFLPPHSYVMFSLCLRLQQYGQLMCSGDMTGNVWYLLRGALGSTVDCEYMHKCIIIMMYTCIIIYALDLYLNMYIY